MQIDWISGSAGQFQISNGNGGFGWNLPCCDTVTDVFELTYTGGFTFSLVSIDVLHADPGEGPLFEGYLGGGFVRSQAVNSLFGGGVFTNFGATIPPPGPGPFDEFDFVRLTVAGNQFTDPTFDNLVVCIFDGRDCEPRPVPEPATLLLFGGGLSLVAVRLRRRGRA